MVILIEPINPKISKAITDNISFINIMEKGYKRSIKVAERGENIYINSGPKTEVFKTSEVKEPIPLIIFHF